MVEVIIFTALGTIVFLSMCAWMYNLVKAWREQNDSRAQLTVAVAGMNKQLEQFSITSDTIAKMLGGLVEVSKVQVEHLDILTETIKEFRTSLIRDTAGDSFTEFDERAADREHDVQEYMRNGMSRKEAEARVNSADVWKNMTVRS